MRIFTYDWLIDYFHVKKIISNIFIALRNVDRLISVNNNNTNNDNDNTEKE